MLKDYLFVTLLQQHSFDRLSRYFMVINNQNQLKKWSFLKIPSSHTIFDWNSLKILTNTLSNLIWTIDCTVLWIPRECIVTCEIPRYLLTINISYYFKKWKLKFAKKVPIKDWQHKAFLMTLIVELEPPQLSSLCTL